MFKITWKSVAAVLLTLAAMGCSAPGFQAPESGGSRSLSVHASMNLRGSFNAWENLPMSLVNDNTWEAKAVFSGAGAFKFDVTGNWSTNYGDNNGDGTAELGGANIAVPSAGTYIIRFNDSTKTYSFTLDNQNGFVGLYYQISNPMSPMGFYNLVGLDVGLYKGSDLVSNTKISSAEHGNPYSGFSNLSPGTYKVKLDALYYSYAGGTATRLHYTGEKTFDLTPDKMNIDPLWMSVYEGAAYDVMVYMTPYYGSYTSPLLGLPAKIYRDGVLLKTQELVNGGKAVGYQPVLLLNPLDTGAYEVVLDSVVQGTRYTGNVQFNVGVKGPMYLSPNPVMTVTDSPAAVKTIRYYNPGFAQAYLHYLQDSGVWTQAPGVLMTKDADSWFSVTVQDADSVTFAFNNGNGAWDSASGANYSGSSQELWVKNSTVYTSKPTSTVVLKALPTGVSEQYVVQVRGSKAPLSWTSGLPMTYNRNEKSFTASFEVEGSFEYKYVITDSAGTVKWEILGGNRTGVSGTSYTDSPVF